MRGLLGTIGPLRWPSSTSGITRHTGRYGCSHVAPASCPDCADGYERLASPAEQVAMQARLTAQLPALDAAWGHTTDNEGSGAA